MKMSEIYTGQPVRLAGKVYFVMDINYRKEKVSLATINNFSNIKILPKPVEVEKLEEEFFSDEIVDLKEKFRCALLNVEDIPDIPF
jgi:hypothetical protein